MVNKILIFRTDRIGDLILTCPALLTIKNNLSNPQITLIASKKNFACAKSLQIFDKVDLFPQKSLFSKIKFIYYLSRLIYNYIENVVQILKNIFCILKTQIVEILSRCMTAYKVG